MKYLLEVGVIAISMTLGVIPTLAQSASSDEVPVLRKGITVELPRTTSAVSVPEADNEDALVIAIKPDGGAYLGANPISIAELGGKLKDALAARAERKVYLKADARAPYASVVAVLDSLHSSGIDGVTLLTVQSEASAPGSLVPPKGLVMQMVAPRAKNRSTVIY